MRSFREEQMQDENPWKQFAELQKPERGVLAVAACLYALASVAISLSFLGIWFSMLFGILLLAGAFYLTRRMASGAVLTLVTGILTALLGAAFVASPGISVAIGTVAVALGVGVMSGCFFATSTRYWGVPVLLSAFAAVVAYAATGNWFSAVAAFTLFPATLLLGVATNRGEYRTTAICYTIGGMLFSAIALFLLWFWKENGTLSPTVILNAWDHLREQMIAEQIALRNENLDYFNKMLSSEMWNEAQVEAFKQNLDLIMQVMSDENLTDSVTLMFNLFPAFVFVACAVPAFLAQKMLNAAYFGNGMKKVLTPECEFFTMSVPAAVLFILTTFVTLLFSGNFNIPVTVADNICIMLLPGFLVIGVRTYHARLLSLKGGARGMFIALSLFLVCCSSVGAFLLLGMYGAYARVQKAFLRKIAEKMNGDNGRPDDE